MNHKSLILLTTFFLASTAALAQTPAASQEKPDLQGIESATPKNPGDSPIPEKLQKKGKDLQADIANAYERFKASGALKTAVKGGNDVTDIVVKYIPIGTSFDDAEKILRASGCKISTWKSKQHSDLNFKDNVVGEMNVSGGMLTTEKLIVLLTPQAPGNYGPVNKVWAGISLYTP